MKVLFVDTTTPDLIVSLVCEDKIIDVNEKSVGVKHSETLCVKVDELLRKAGVSFAEIDAYACAVGPGSFTGIRIGISTLKGYRAAFNRPFIEVGCLEAIASSLNCGNCKSAVIDAGNGYYFADYANGVNPCLIGYDDERAVSAGKAESAADYFDGAVKLIRNKFQERLFSESLTPLYIRRSQAEEKR